MSLVASTVPFVFNREEQQNDVAHDMHMPNIGLGPNGLDLPEKESWFADKLSQANNEWVQVLRERWQHLYCKMDSAKTSQFPVEELALRCLRLRHPSSYPSFIENWFQKELGVTVAEANSVLGFIQVAE